MTVELTPAEYHHAAHAGFIRCMKDTLGGVRDRRPTKEGRYDIDVLGAVGEFAVARLINVFWPGPGKLRGADCGESVQVRATPYDSGRLILHPEDSDDEPYVLVTGQGCRVTVRGWVYGRDGKRPEFWSDPTKGRPAFFVPQASLRDIGELRGVSE